MTENELRPAAVAVERSRRMLVIHWNDAHVSEYDLAGLREACPCAQCRTTREKPRIAPQIDILNIPLTPVNSDRIQHIELVGNYALQITWADGHKYGIYSWEYLRALCPCTVCAAPRKIS